MDKDWRYYGGDTVVVSEEYGGGCRTPTREDCRIPAEAPCPPPVRRKNPLWCGKRRGPPQNGFFRPPDLKIFFTSAANNRPASCAHITNLVR
ncbi:PREDICTED: uncharacterized protein LOC109117261 [Tarenaya hassleriana]|uniref:uncharacterized protein LOC109117261 n=1 Tax=Tarenaya hassleriana TaxID=28532 RepID=UPI0008FCFC11|nr:PREDICTED: uncharacterized protein LOC109117261 [Tarenaya hassleriana]